MRFSKVEVYPAFSREILVEWEVERATDPGDYLFVVERSGSPAGPFVCLTPTPLPNAYFFIDRTLPLLSKENLAFYRVKATTPSGEIVVSPAKDLYRNLEREQWLISREITRKEILRFRKKVGVRSAVLKKKHFGEKCTTCVDPVSGSVTDSQCSECFGTTFLDGYHPPVEAWVETSPLPDNKGLGGQGWMTEDFTGQIRMVSYPHVTRDDIIVELESNRRLRAIQVDPIELRTVPIILLVTVRMISRSDIEYRIPAHVTSDPCGKQPNREAQIAPHGSVTTAVQSEDVC